MLEAPLNDPKSFFSKKGTGQNTLTPFFSSAGQQQAHPYAFERTDEKPVLARRLSFFFGF